MPPSMVIGHRAPLKPWNPIPLDNSPRTPSYASLVGRSDDSSPSGTFDGSDNMINMLILILGIVFVGLILISFLFFLRRVRRLRQLRNQGLPTYNEVQQNPKNYSGLTIETKHNGRSSVFVLDRTGQPMLQNPSKPPDSPDNVPEIRITFPDEQDAQGRQTNGRVLVVRVGDNATVGLEPMQDEQLPAYEKDAKGQFYSINMDHIGGLKEKDRNLYQ